MQGWRWIWIWSWRWSLPVVAAGAAEAGRGCAGRGKNHDVTAAGTKDFCLVRERQHYVAGPQVSRTRDGELAIAGENSRPGCPARHPAGCRSLGKSKQRFLFDV